jgi:hypothetical protein
MSHPKLIHERITNSLIDLARFQISQAMVGLHLRHTRVRIAYGKLFVLVDKTHHNMDKLRKDMFRSARVFEQLWKV